MRRTSTTPPALRGAVGVAESAPLLVPPRVLPEASSASGSPVVDAARSGPDAWQAAITSLSGTSTRTSAPVTIEVPR